ncbi:MAG: hypothetical protein AB7N91_22320 [Candidatus Tectimicrobiota bacterium]
MRRLIRPWRSLGMCLSFLGVLYLSGCSSPVGQAAADDVSNRAFAFADGAVFHAALANQPTTLLFLDNASAFTLFSADGSGTAAGSNRLGSCQLTVTSSTYAPAAGPQVNDVITLDPCDYDSDNSTLTVSNRGITSTSATAVARVVAATASDVRNRSFLFNVGAVFNEELDGATAVAFNGNASEFTLETTTGDTTGTAEGVVQLSPCRLTVRSSTYRTGGPDAGDVIEFNACRFNGGNRTLILSRGSITESSI